jgi:hypothetical protein
MDGVESGCSEETAAPSTALRSVEKHSQEGTADTADLSTPLRSVERHFQERTAGPQISPLRSFGAPVEMTKGEGGASIEGSCWKNVFHHLGWVDDP